MFKNYAKITLRNIAKYKGYSFINIAGLAIGMACCILILLWVKDELSYDRYHQKADQIYRVLQGKSARTSFPVATKLVENFPEIIEAVRITIKWERLVYYDNKRFLEKEFIYVDPNIFEVFSFPLILGNTKTALQEPLSIVISEEMAHKYFGDENPLGKVLNIENEFNYTVTGVMKNLPHNSHFRADLMATLVGSKLFGMTDFMEHWGLTNAFTYLVLHKNCSIHDLESKFSESIVKPMKERNPELTPPKLHLQPLKSIHLYSSDIGLDIESQGDINYIYIFSAIAFCILFIACVNYMNLSTARSISRSKEVGIKKVLGSSRARLIYQFVGESLFFTGIAAILALILVELLIPLFNSLTGKTIAVKYLGNWNILLGFVGIILLVGLISGSYPAIFLSKYRPAIILRGLMKTGSKNIPFRRILVVIQFSISIVLIIATYIIFSQINYFKNKKLGFNKQHVIVTEIPDTDARQKNELFKNKLLQNAQILDVSFADRVPPDYIGWWTDFQLQDTDEVTWMPIVPVDYNYFKILCIEIKEGRTFSRTFGTDEEQSLILNECAVQKLGLKSAIGKTIRVGIYHPNRTIIGVVKDFHFESLHQKIRPMAFFIDYDNCWQVIIRIRPENIHETVNFIKTEWTEIYPDWIFEYRFLDEKFNYKYRSEEKIGQLVGYFTLLAIFIACLGLFGLASFTVDQRTKEIVIRKVLGASIGKIVILLSKDFTIWVLIANIIAWPIACYAMNKWLQNFAYRINLEWWTFVFAGLLTLLIALLTVIYQSIKAAVANPVESLRYE